MLRKVRAAMAALCGYAGVSTVALATTLASDPLSVPPAIWRDTPSDPAHPARMVVLHIPTHGVRINGVAYLPSGDGLHPVLVIFNGLPGNERNLDLAQVVRRAGWIAITLNYRGSWGSPGTFGFAHTLEDADATLGWLREPDTAGRLNMDVKRIVIAGHSMGGWVVAQTAAHDHALLGTILISMGDMGRLGAMPRRKLIAAMDENKESLAGVSANSMAAELIAHAHEFRTQELAPQLVNIPILAVTSDDGLASDTEALVEAINTQGGHRVVTQHEATDHGWSDHRIALESAIVQWLAGLTQAPVAR